MAFFKNLKDSIANKISERVSDIKENITDRVTGIKDTVTGTVSGYTSGLKMMKEILGSGDLSKMGRNISFMKEGGVKDDGTRKDAKLPYKEAMELFFLDKNMRTGYLDKKLSGSQGYKSDDGASMFTHLLSVQEYSDSEILIANLFVWDEATKPSDEVREKVISQLKNRVCILELLYPNSEPTCVGAMKIYDLKYLTKEQVLKDLEEFYRTQSYIVPILEDYFKPVFAAKDAREREERAKRARENGLAQSYNQNLLSDITVRRVQENFTEDYPYLRMGFFLVQTGKSADKSGGTISSISSDTLLGKIRSYKYSAKVNISGSDTPETLEKKFRDSTGLVIKICYNDEKGSRYYISKDQSNYTTKIYDLNEKFRKAGYHKADIS